MSRFKAIIFDLDGTLVDSVYDIADAGNVALKTLGYPPHSYEEYRHFIGHGLRELCRKSLPEDQREEAVIDSCHRLLAAHYQAHSTDKTRLFPGMEEVLEKCRRQGLKLAVLSNKADILTQDILRRLNIHSWFKVVTGLRDGFARKPDPKGVFWVCNCLNCPKENILYVGDSAIDMQTARAAGLESVACRWGYRPEEELLNEHPDHIIRQPLELLDILF